MKNNILEPIKTDLAPAPDYIVKYIRCSCKKGWLNNQHVLILTENVLEDTLLTPSKAVELNGNSFKAFAGVVSVIACFLTIWKFMIHCTNIIQVKI